MMQTKLYQNAQKPKDFHGWACSSHKMNNEVNKIYVRRYLISVIYTCVYVAIINIIILNILVQNFC